MQVDAQAAAPLLQASEPGGASVSAYLAALLLEFTQPASEGPASLQPPRTNPASPEAVLTILSQRRFTHLAPTAARSYRTRLLPALACDLDARRPVRFCYDLGPGYHASLCADFSGLRFQPGLGELLALRQIRRFSQAVEAVHPPGVHICLVIDDLCAWIANDVPLTRTSGYLARLVALINDVGMQERVSVIAESALQSADAYRRAFEQEPLRPWTGPIRCVERQNVCRFLGRAATEAEVQDRLERYQRAQSVSERLLARHLHGIRMTQRATAQCWGFRSFPGSDSRLQCGEVDLILEPGKPPRPKLITRHHADRVQRWPVPAQDLPEGWPLPAGVVHVASLTTSLPGSAGGTV